MIESLSVKRSPLLLGVVLSAAPLLAQNVVGDLYSGDASVRGSITLSAAGMRVLNGSQVAAGEAAALLKLNRGGQLRICPKTTLSLNEGANSGLVLGLNAGAMELDYALASGSDTLLTPDFRLQLISPGTFHLAISVAPSGDTCLRTLSGDDAAVFVAEMIGSDSYQLSPGKSVFFRAGKISGTTDAPASCGCPEPKPAAISAVPVPPPKPEAEAPAPPSAAAAAQPHLEADSSFAFHGDRVTEDIAVTVARLSLSNDNSMLAMALLPRVSPPPEAAPKPERQPSLMRRIASFFHRIFR